MLATPAVHVGTVLRECRIREYEFHEAWMTAMRSLPRGGTQEQRAYLAEWKEALRWAKENFHAAYEQRTFHRPLGRVDGVLLEYRRPEPAGAGRQRNGSVVEVARLDGDGDHGGRDDLQQAAFG